MDCGWLGSSAHGIFQARMLEWLPFPVRRDLPDPGIKPVSLASPALADRFITTVPPGKPFLYLLFANTLVKTRYIKMTALGFKQPATYQGKT